VTRRGALGASGLVLVALVALLAVGPGRVRNAYGSWATNLRTTAEAVPAAGLQTETAPPGAGSLLIAVADEGEGAAFALLTTQEDGAAVVVVIPADLYDLVPGYGTFPLSSALAFEGTDLAALVVSNAVGVTVDAVVAIEGGAISDLLGDDVAVDLSSDLEVEQPDGTLVRLAAAGNALRTPETVGQLFTTRGRGELLLHLERQAATWEGFVHAVASHPRAAADFAAGSSNPELAAGLLAAASDLTVTLVPVARVGSGEAEGFEVELAEVADFVNRRLPHLALAPGVRPAVEILNGNGRLRTTRAVADALVARGFRVIRTDNAEHFDFPQTIVLGHGEPNTEAAREVVRALGVGDLRLELATPSGIVDVSIIVGHDVPAGEG